MTIPQRALKFSENSYENLCKITQYKERVTTYDRLNEFYQNKELPTYFQVYNISTKKEIYDVNSLSVNLDDSTSFL
ncbi:unnamed protein product [Blepharisma stoltei]|uniref:Uncharacterized protein n=1 Tax=Blepharisma stoltei TaxID=1481888 RepID=A0AAU9K5T2_9CILI|nr:unnamed protein product [Blepharisma stoltei]